MEFIPAHNETKQKTEMQAGMGFGVNPANGNLEHHYGFFPVVVNYTVNIPDALLMLPKCRKHPHRSGGNRLWRVPLKLRRRCTL
jgi:hypothetical protein